MRTFIVALIAALAVAGGFTSAASAQNRAGDSLVNVQIGDVTLLLPISVAANVCDVAVNVLATQADTGEATCTATAESIATPGNGGNGGGNTAGNSLVNVQVGDITLRLPIAVAANVCDLDVNVLARQLSTGDASCVADASSEG
jgi:hypothetical protein